MRFLLDTHIWLWWTAGSPRLDPETRRIVDDRSNEVIFSAASAWEVAIKYRIGRLALPDSPKSYVKRQLALQSIRALDVTIEHALETAELPLHHGDPFDRVLIAQARCECLTLVTADEALRPYAVAQLHV